LLESFSKRGDGKMFKYVRNSRGEIIKDFAGNPFTFMMTEDADGFMRDILGYSFSEYSIHYFPRRGDDRYPSAQEIEASVKVA
jgi:hypothetical protein